MPGLPESNQQLRRRASSCGLWLRRNWYWSNYCIFAPASLSAFLYYITFDQDGDDPSIATLNVMAGVLEIISATARIGVGLNQVKVEGCQAVKNYVIDLGVFSAIFMLMLYLVQSDDNSEIADDSIFIAVNTLILCSLLAIVFFGSKPPDNSNQHEAMETGQAPIFSENNRLNIEPRLPPTPDRSHAFIIVKTLSYFSDRLGSFANQWYISLV